jgi:hypothetical protein
VHRVGIEPTLLRTTLIKSQVHNHSATDALSHIAIRNNCSKNSSKTLKNNALLILLL